MAVNNNTAKYNGREVQIFQNYIGRNDTYVSIVDADGTHKLVRKDSLIFDFNNKNTENGYEALMGKIKEREEEINDGQELMKTYAKLHSDSIALMHFTKNKMYDILHNSNASSEKELTGNEAEMYAKYKDQNSTAIKTKNRACSNLLSKSISLVSDILGTGKLKLQAIMMRDNNYPMA